MGQRVIFANGTFTKKAKPNNGPKPDWPKARKEREKVTIERQHNGSWLITEIVHNVLVKQVYYGYTLREAKADFRRYLKTLKPERKVEK